MRRDNIKKNLKTPKGTSESVNRRRKKKKDKRSTTYLIDEYIISDFEFLSELLIII